MAKNPEDLYQLTALGFLPQLSIFILADQFINSLRVQDLEVLSWVEQLENLGLGLSVQFQVVKNHKLRDTQSFFNCDERIFLQDDLSLLDLPGSEQSPPLSRRLPDDEGRTGWLVGFPVLHLALLAAVGNLLTDTTFQRLLWLHLAEVTGTHLLLCSLRSKTIKHGYEYECRKYIT